MVRPGTSRGLASQRPANPHRGPTGRDCESRRRPLLAPVAAPVGSCVVDAFRIATRGCVRTAKHGSPRTTKCGSGYQVVDLVMCALTPLYRYASIASHPRSGMQIGSPWVVRSVDIGLRSSGTHLIDGEGVNASQEPNGRTREEGSDEQSPPAAIPNKARRGV
jgi:hypothetical protein